MRGFSGRCSTAGMPARSISASPPGRAGSVTASTNVAGRTRLISATIEAARGSPKSAITTPCFRDRAARADRASSIQRGDSPTAPNIASVARRSAGGQQR